MDAALRRWNGVAYVRPDEMHPSSWRIPANRTSSDASRSYSNSACLIRLLLARLADMASRSPPALAQAAPPSRETASITD